MHRVFVYGSLLRGLYNHHILDGAPRVAKTRTVEQFELLDLGAYPGLREGGKNTVAGEVYEVDDRGLARLDRLEDHPVMYRRRVTPLADGSSAWIYVLTARTLAEVGNVPVVASGDWTETGKA